MRLRNPAATLTVLLPTILGGATVSAAEPAGARYTWRNVKVGGGGYIPGIVFSRAERGLAYLRSDMGGCYRWDAAAQCWVPLQDAMDQSSYYGIESIAPDPVDPDVVYAAAGMYRKEPSAILRSRDRGRTWQVSPVTFHMGGNEDGRGLGERLAIDPNETSILYFGSRHDGLHRSTDRGRTWTKVDAFPLVGRGQPPDWNHPTNGGLSFVVFDRTSGSKGSASTRIFVGVADPGKEHLFRSDNAGQTWKAIPGGPGKEMLPAQAQIDDDGRFLYVTYGTGLPPTNVPDGCVMKLDVRSGAWTDVTPDKRPDRPGGGYCGLSLDRQHPGTLAIATMNRWHPTDTVWRSTDGGATWNDIAAKAKRDVSAAPFLLWGKNEARLGWWMSALAIDPFDSNHACYATGATIYASRDFSKVSEDVATHWAPWVEGIEQTAVITLTSPTAGAPLFSGFGDIGGFVHDDLSVSPPGGMYQNPQFGNTNTIDHAERQPNVVVRSGRPNDGQANLGYSEDGGRRWMPLVAPSAAGAANDGRLRRGVNPAIILSADGATFVVMTRPTPHFTRDRGASWTAVTGLPPNARLVADRVDPKAFFALDFNTGKLYESTDSGATFAERHSTGLPPNISGDEPTSHEAAWPLVATLGRPGDLWLVSKTGLFHSSDGGATFTRAGEDSGVAVEALSFGKAAAGSRFPALYAIGTKGKLKAIWRSDDIGETWLRVNDERHQYGMRFRCIAGDPRIFGRVYVGTDGRGIVYGSLATRDPIR